MRTAGNFLTTRQTLYCASVLLCISAVADAQRHGGGTPAPGLGTISRPDGVEQKDTLKDFHRALALQATAQQAAEFRFLITTTEAAKTELEHLLVREKDDSQKDERARGKSDGESTPPIAPANSALAQALERARGENKKFTDSFSDAQKSGLKEITKRLDKANSDMEQEQRRLDQSLRAANAAAPEITARAETLDKALTDFYNQQLALGREMSIPLARGQDLTFNLPSVKSPARIANHIVAVGVSGELTQTAVEGNQRTFRLDVDADLSELQQKMTELLRDQLERSDRCGEHLEIRRAMLSPSTPASSLFVSLHFERWTCVGGYGQSTPTEVAESDGSVELRLTPGLDKSSGPQMKSEFTRIDASGMLADALRSGDLGDDLRDKATDSVLSALRSASDFKATLPPVLQDAATVQTVKFQDTGAGNLRVVLEGQVQISSEQANTLASQLNQTLSAQGAVDRIR